MIISSLTEAEEFVRERPLNFQWEQWDIARLTQDDYAEYLPNGVFVNGQWYQKTIFPLTTDGWVIPDTYIRMAKQG